MASIGGVKIDFDINRDQILERIGHIILSDRCSYICTVNAEFIVDAQKDSEFKDILNRADISAPDGVGVVIAYTYEKKVQQLTKNILFPVISFIYGICIGIDILIHPLKYRKQLVKGSELMYDICDFASKNGYSVFFLGGMRRDVLGRKNMKKGDLASDVAYEMKKMCPNLSIVGASSKYVHAEADDDRTLSYVHKCMKYHNKEHIDILFVAYGHINQEKWIKRNMYKIPAKVSIGVGGAFDYVFDRKRCVLEMFRMLNLETFYRLLTQFWRIGRIVIACLVFPLFVYISALRSHNK